MRLDIARMGQKGEGIAETAEGNVFVPGALPGEEVDIDGGRLSVVTPSPDRIAPHCRHFGICGGCQVQHWVEPAYRGWKRGLVEQALRHHGVPSPVEPLIDAHGAGRRRAAFHVRKTGGRIVAGFMARGSHDLVDIESCPVLEPRLAAAPEIARTIGAAAGASDVWLTAADGGLDAAIKAGREMRMTLTGKIADIAQRFDLARVTFNGETIVERRAPSVTMGPARVKLPPNAFLQATAAGEAELARLVLGHLSGAKRAADLFCGTGPFALRLARNIAVFAADSDGAAVNALKDAARRTQGLKPVEVAKRDLFREPLTARELEAFDAVVLDPPRAGAEAQVRRLADSKVKRVASVSCDVQTFARDAAILIAGGYALETVTPVDQFRHTPHVEIAGLFRRQSLARST